MQNQDWQRPSLLGMLIYLTVIFICWQLAFFAVHYQVATLFDSLTNTSISLNLFHLTFLVPIFVFILIQLLFYALIIYYIYGISIGLEKYFQLSYRTTYCIGIACLAIALSDLILLNSYFFPFSFFAVSISFSPFFLLASVLFWLALSIIAFRKIGWLLAVFISINLICTFPPLGQSHTTTSTQPNIILIGLDSLRPDHTGFYGNLHIKTPNIDNFLKNSASFSTSYVPLARTFPSWTSILTSQYPKHIGIRNNLAAIDASHVNTLAKQLQQTGYYTIYASDEKRFSNITQDYGFDQLSGPSMGVNDFILGSLSDFPLTNLLTKLPIARFLMPYNYGNRGAAITYNPNHFLNNVNSTLAQRPNQPLFLAIHLCLTHWPFYWASPLGKDEISAQKYRHTVEAIDKQFGQLLAILQRRDLLNNTIVVLLSDHGAALGLPHDALLDEKTYQGNAKLLKNLPRFKLNGKSPDSLDYKNDYSTSTSYGQGTNVASLKQYHTLLAFREYGRSSFRARRISTPVSLLDISPTVLAMLNLPLPKQVDGTSLAGILSGKIKNLPTRAFFIETGDTIKDIETDQIYLENVIAQRAGVYTVNKETGLLTMDPLAEKALIKGKQRAIILGDWLLAHYPISTGTKLVPVSKNSSELTMKTFMIPAYYVLINIRTGQWTIGFDTPFAKTAPVAMLHKKLKQFYGDELPS